MSTPVQRFTPDWTGRAMFKSSHGKYVRHTDHEAVMQALRDENEVLRTLLRNAIDKDKPRPGDGILRFDGG